MITAALRDKVEREIRRTENHLDALYDILDEIDKEVPKRKVMELGKWLPLIEESLSTIRGTRVFSVKEVTAIAQEIDTEVDRRVIYNCIKSYLKRHVRNGTFEQVNSTEYKRVNGGKRNG